MSERQIMKAVFRKVCTNKARVAVGEEILHFKTESVVNFLGGQ